MEGEVDNEYYKIQEGILQKWCKTSWNIYLPDKFTNELITLCHEVYTHIGTKKCQAMISEDFYIPRLLRKTKKLLGTCEVCQKNKSINYKVALKPQYISLSEPMEVIFKDFCGPLPIAGYGNRYILVILDGFTKYVKTIPHEETNNQGNH